MGRPRGSKNSKSMAKSKGSEKKPTSADAKKTKSMDAIMGVGTLEIPNSSEEEGEILSPRSSLHELQKQSDDKQLFSQWLEVINSSSKSSKRVSGDGKTEEVSDKGKLNEIDAMNVLDSNVIEVNCNKQPIIHDQLNTEGGMKDGQMKDAVIDTGDIPEIELEDIQEEISFWESSIVCYILGANPPLMVIEGFIRRIWGKFVLIRLHH